MLVGIVTLKSAPWELEDNFRRLEGLCPGGWPGVAPK